MDANRLRAAMALPGRQWMPGMEWKKDVGPWATTTGRVTATTMTPPEGALPVLDDACTAGGLLALLGESVLIVACEEGWWSVDVGDVDQQAPTLGEACVEVALALGRWPGGAP